MKNVNFEYTIQVETEPGSDVFQEIELQVSGTAYPAEKGSKDADGFQVEPDADGYFEVENIYDQYGKEYAKEDLPDDWDEIERIGYEVAAESEFDFIYDLFDDVPF